MIDQHMEPYYDIIINIFIGIIIVIFFHKLYNSPRMVFINDSNKHHNNVCNKF